MKKSKLQLLLFFLHHTEQASARDNIVIYSQLYRALTLAPSTVRGIVQEFLSAGILRHVYGEESEGYVLSSRGRSLARDEFPGLVAAEEETAGHLVFMPQNVQFQSAGRYVQLDTHTFFVFDGIHRQSSRASLSMAMSANEKSIVEWWWSTQRGKTAYDRRGTLVKISQQISLQIRGTSPYSGRSRKAIEKFFQEFISAAQSKSDVPELYYTHQMRLRSLLTHFWKA